MNYNFSQKMFILKQIVKRNLTSKYRDSVLGVLWTFLNPLFMMLVFTAVFSFVFSRTIDNFPVFFLTGNLIYIFFSAGSSQAMNSIKSSAGILKQIYVPRYMFALGSVIAEFINLLISFLILIGVMYITHAQFHLYTSLFASIPICLLFLLTLGAGLLLSVLNTYYSDVSHLYSVFTLALMYASGIFYPLTIIPPFLRFYFELNPIYCAISCFRDYVMYGVFPAFSTLIYLAIWSFGLLITGIIVFKLFEKKLTLEL